MLRLSSLVLLSFINIISICFGVPKFQKYGSKGNSVDESKRNLKYIIHSETGPSSLKLDTDGNCWMSLNAKKHFEKMDEIDEQYKNTRETYQNSLGVSFSQNILETLLKTKGIATRELFRNKEITDKIPAGLNLGGECMMRMPESILFFHRIKLRNNTYFRVNMLDVDLVNMVLKIRLSLNDLHLAGAYGRVLTDRGPGILYYTPTFGEVEFLLKDANFNAEGRLRLVKDRLWIELIDSKITTGDNLMSYSSDKSSIYLRPGNIEDVLERMKTDLQKWLKDYFNDFFMFHPLNKPPSTQFQEAENERTHALNDYADYAIQAIIHKIREINATAVQIPPFTLRGSNRLVIKLHDGALRGLDTIYRRSVATGKKEGQLRKVDIMIGFSSLKVLYRYEAELPNGLSSLTGAIILTSDDLAGHLAISLVNNPEAVDINIDSIEQMKPESLTVEGSANRLISTYKHVLEHHIIAIMTNTLYHEIKMLRSLPRCTPSLKANIESREIGFGVKNKKSDQLKPESFQTPQTVSEQPDQQNVSGPSNNSPESTLTPKHTSSIESENSTEAQNNEYEQNMAEKSKEKQNQLSSNELPLTDNDQSKSEPESDPEAKSSSKANYWLTKNESMEIEVPNKEEPGKVQRVKVHRLEEYKIIDK
ncbi:hypothetical protein K1T71_007690 [Dendrolimus kikuchii]|uniref:Uncharacterized protein n=1 Tax=Dendrolimus kikuchii TaxID=765133 RepID=A0ACC1CY59_9NEOP|nr:hypothetical protein K1T71_007690 [Dendrolimus kikuchii]